MTEPEFNAYALSMKPQAPFAGKISDVKHFIELINSDPEAWYRYIAAHQLWANKTIGHYAARMSAFQQDYDNLKKELKDVSAENTTLKNLIVTGFKSEKFPDPERYAGERGDKLDQFIFKLESKLEVNADRYPTTESRLLYGYSRLTGKAAAQALPRMTAQYDKLVTVEQLIAFLKFWYENVDGV